MQNEISELRNQVRTLKRMLFGVFGLVVVGGLLAAASSYVSTWGAGEVVTGIMPGSENTDGVHQAAGHGDDYEREAQARRANQRIPIPSNEELREIYNRASPQSKPSRWYNNSKP